MRSEIAEQKSSLEILAEEIRKDLSQFLGESLIAAGFNNNGENVFYIARFAGREFIIGRKKYESVLTIEEKTIGINGGKKVILTPVNEDVRKFVQPYRTRYLEKNPEVSYFTILRNPKTARFSFGFS